MSVNESITAYSTTAASNTPAGTDNIGTDLDDHLRDIKKNIRTLSNTVSAQGTDINSVVSDVGGINYISQATTLSSDYPIEVSGALSSGATIGLNQWFSSGTNSGALYVSRIDPWGRVLNFGDVSELAASHLAASSGVQNDAFMTPDNLGYAPEVAKVWVTFDGSGTGSLTHSYHCSSVTRSAQGVYVLNYSVTFLSAERTIPMINYGLGVSGNTLTRGSATKTTTYYKFKLVTTAAGAAQDCATIDAVVFGVYDPTLTP